MRIPVDSVLCLHALRGDCRFGTWCWKYHPEPREQFRLLKMLAQLPCPVGSACERPGCVYAHPPRVENSKADLTSQVARASSTSSESSGRCSGSSGCWSSRSPSPEGQSATAVKLQPGNGRQFLQRKLEPARLFEGPGFAIFYKPAGWCGHMPSSVKDDLLCSGRVEALRSHSVVEPPERPWSTFLSPADLVSGLTLLVDSENVAKLRFTHALSMGHLVSYSVALVAGAPQPGHTAAAAHRVDGSFEVSALAVFDRASAAGWSGEAGSQSYTLVVMKASGGAIGGERALLKLTWLQPALGDAEQGCDTAESWFGGRPFIHGLGLIIRDAWWAAGSAAILSPLPLDLRNALAELAPCGGPLGDGGAERLRKALWSTGLLPRDMLADLGLDVGPAADVLSTETPSGPIDPAPFGHTSWGDGVPRRQWIWGFVQQALQRTGEYGLQLVGEGWVDIRALVNQFPQLLEASCGSIGMLIYDMSKDMSKTLQLGGELRGRFRTLVRRLPACERLQAFVQVYASNLAPGSKLPVAELLQNGFIKQLLCGKELPQKPLLACLSPCALFDVDPSATFLELRPPAERLRLGLEELVAQQESLLSKRLSEGGVPLSWVLNKYCKELCGSDVPLQLLEAAAALASSQSLAVDPGTFTLHLISKQAHGSMIQALRSGRMKMRRPKLDQSDWITLKVLRLLRSLFDFYCEPFFVQHSRILLHSAEEGAWRWPISRLAKDLKRIGAELMGLSQDQVKELLEAVFKAPLEHARLVMGPEELAIELNYEADFRMPVVLSHASDWVREHFVLLDQQRRLSAPPAGASMILSYSLDVAEGSELASVAAAPGCPYRLARNRWRNKILRSIVAYSPDLICIQLCESDLSESACSSDVSKGWEPAQVEPPLSSGWNQMGHAGNVQTLWKSIIRRLESEDYGWAAVPATTSGFVNAIFWRRSKWAASSWSPGAGALHVNLRPWEGIGQLSITCVASCSREELSLQLRSLKAQMSSPAVICGSFGIEPNEVAEVMGKEGLQARSAYAEVLGHEPWTQLGSVPKSSDGIWLRSSVLSPMGVLGGHARPRRTPDGSTCRRTFPADHLPLVLALEHTASAGAVLLKRGGPPELLPLPMLAGGA